MKHTIISGIEKFTLETEQKLRAVSTIAYKKIESQEALIKEFKSCDIFWFRLNHKITKKVLENARCKFILCAATGLDHIDLVSCQENDIKVISLKGESEFLKEVRATAEHTLGLLLGLIRKTKNAFSHVENGNWNRYIFQGSELYKKKVGIYGMGRLGKIVAEYYHTMGMEVFYYDILNEEIDKKFHKTKSAKELFKTVDIISVHLPYNDSTHCIIDEDLLSNLKQTAVIVNTARGGVVDENALLQRLIDKKIAGYATDVLFGEPNIAKHPLILFAKKNENVIITPHIGGNTFESIEKTEAFVLEKLIKILN